MKEIYCMRHGQTNYNVLGLCNDDPARPVNLTDLGRAQAREAAERLAAVPLQIIHTSQLPRTLQTAAIVNHRHNVPIQPHALLNDIRSGFDSRPVTDYFAAIAADRLHAKVPGGESVLEHKQRVPQFIDWLLARPENVALVVAHEETLRVFAARFNQLDDRAMLAVTARNGEIFHWRVKP